MRRAAQARHLEVLRWAREHGCPWDVSNVCMPAYHGYLNVLKWAREHDCPWNADICTIAAEGGHLEVLQWAREHHCPWDEPTCSSPLGDGTWRCCSGRGSTTTHGWAVHDEPMKPMLKAC